MLSCFHFLDLAYFMSDIKRLIKHLGTFFQSSIASTTSLSSVISPADMRASFAAIVDGGVSEIELGALMAMCANLESQRKADLFTEILLGLSESINERAMPIECEPNDYLTVVIPNYGGETFGNAIPLIAIKLQRMGIRVLVHGALETTSGLANCGIFRELDVLPVTTRGQAERRLAENGLALVPTSLISPGLSAMMALKARLGVCTPAHVLADMLMPVSSTPQQSLHVVNVPAWLTALADSENVVMQTPALLSRTVEISGCKFGSLNCRPQLKYRAGADSQIAASTHDAHIVEDNGWQILFPEEMHSQSHPDHLPLNSTFKKPYARGQANAVPTDTRSLAAWTRQRLDASMALPQPVVNQLACCLYGAGYAEDFNQAKAMAAVETGSLAA
jgi:anthranilate phosphoribosyltransferase